MRAYRARQLLTDSLTLVPGGGVVVKGNRIAAVLRHGEAAPVPEEDLGDVVLAPGLVNAHCHLDLSALHGRVPAEGGFGAWIGRLLAERATVTDAECDRAIEAALQRLYETGTTFVGDIDTLGRSPRRIAASPLGGVHYREVLDAQDPTRTEEALSAARAATDEHGDEHGDGALRPGISPHAPFSVSEPLLAGLPGDAPLAIHWSETEAEVEWLESGTGPLAPLLGESTGRPGLQRIREAGKLGPGTALIHGNHPRPGEPEEIARAGAALVHCPGTHRFFDREPAPLEAYRRAGVSLALGTDSLASNEDLDMRLEMARLREAHGNLDAATVFSWATEGGARALGLQAGRLAPGYLAAMVAFEVSETRLERILDVVTRELPAVTSVRGPRE